MFITTPQNQVLALNAKTGDILWRYKKELPEDLTQLHPTNRGVGLLEDKVYLATVDCHLLALDAKTGKVVWDTTVENYKNGYYLTLAPLIAKGKVMVGPPVVSWAFAASLRPMMRRRARRSGRPIPSQALASRATTPGLERPGRLGVSVWVTGSYDPQLNLTYWGTGNAAPGPGDMHPGTISMPRRCSPSTQIPAKSKATISTTGTTRGTGMRFPLPCSSMCSATGAPSRVGESARNGYLWLLERTADAIKFVEASLLSNRTCLRVLIQRLDARPTTRSVSQPSARRSISAPRSGVAKMATGGVQSADGSCTSPRTRTCAPRYRRKRNTQRMNLASSSWVLTARRRK